MHLQKTANFVVNTTSVCSFYQSPLCVTCVMRGITRGASRLPSSALPHRFSRHATLTTLAWSCCSAHRFSVDASSACGNQYTAVTPLDWPSLPIGCLADVLVRRRDAPRAGRTNGGGGAAASDPPPPPRRLVIWSPFSDVYDNLALEEAIARAAVFTAGKPAPLCATECRADAHNDTATLVTKDSESTEGEEALLSSEGSATGNAAAREARGVGGAPSFANPVASASIDFPSTWDEVVLLYVNARAVVMGRHQCAWTEAAVQDSTCGRLLPFTATDTECSEEAETVRRRRRRPFQLSRRFSGGGTVAHDSGNLCVSFMCHRDGYCPPRNMAHLKRGAKRELRRQWIELFHSGNVVGNAAVGRPGENQAAFTSQVPPLPESSSLVLELSDRHDMTLNGKKVTGSAMSLKRDMAMHHMTLLVDSDLTFLRRALRAAAYRKEGGAPIAGSSSTDVHEEGITAPPPQPPLGDVCIQECRAVTSVRSPVTTLVAAVTAAAASFRLVASPTALTGAHVARGPDATMRAAQSFVTMYCQSAGEAHVACVTLSLDGQPDASFGVVADAATTPVFSFADRQGHPKGVILSLDHVRKELADPVFVVLGGRVSSSFLHNVRLSSDRLRANAAAVGLSDFWWPDLSVDCLLDNGVVVTAAVCMPSSSGPASLERGGEVGLISVDKSATSDPLGNGILSAAAVSRGKSPDCVERGEVSTRRKIWLPRGFWESVLVAMGKSITGANLRSMLSSQQKEGGDDVVSSYTMTSEKSSDIDTTVDIAAELWRTYYGDQFEASVTRIEQVLLAFAESGRATHGGDAAMTRSVDAVTVICNVFVATWRRSGNWFPRRPPTL